MSVPAEAVDTGVAPAPDQASAAQDTAFREKFDIPAETSIEDYAGELGWRPQDQFRDDPSKWRPATEFIEYGQRNHVVLKENFRKVQAKNLQMERELGELRGVANQFTEFMEGTTKAINERKRENLIEQRIGALETGDHRKAIQIEEALKQLEATPAPAKKPEVIPDHPIVTQYKKDNPWYGSDLEMSAEADEIGERLLKTARNMGQEIDPQGILNSTVNIMKRRYPEKFSKPGERAEPDGRGGTAGGGGFTSSGVRGGARAPIYSNLPANAKAMADNFVSKGLIKANLKDPKDVMRAKDAYAKRFFDAYPSGKIPE